MNAKSPAPSGEHAWFGYAYLVAFVAGLGFFALSFVLLGIIPGRVLSNAVRARAPVTMAAYTLSEERGRVIYGRDGCAYCHTQQVRFVPADVARWGAPTEAWETKFDYPQLWGTRRVGPDLARETGVRSDDWQLNHLYNPRLIVRDSVMPGSPWLFDGGPDRPRQDALDVMAYLQSLGRAPELSGYDSDPPRRAAPASLLSMHADPAMSGLEPLTDANASQARLGGETPGFTVPSEPGAVSLLQGAQVFAANCAGCHGATGAGDGPASASLLPHPANLQAARFAPDRIASVLWNGVSGSAMPAWRDVPTRSLVDLTAHVRSLHAVGQAPAGDPVLVASGHEVFVRNCVSCHGSDGAGDGPSALNLAPRPTSFHLKQPDEASAANTLVNGIPGTSMPSWRTTLSDAERAAVVVYVRSLFKTSTPIGAP